MKSRQIVVTSTTFNDAALAPLEGIRPNLLLIFCSIRFVAECPAAVATLANRFPDAVIAGCTTAGEISDGQVSDDSAVITATEFAGTRLRLAQADSLGLEHSEAVGAEIGRQLAQPDLAAVLVFGQGVNINGSALARSLQQTVGERTSVTGGLAGDAGRFTRTWTVTPAGFSETAVVGVGLYGTQIQVGYRAVGGWSPIGPLHKVTRSVGNVLYELDDVPALDFYKQYLGDASADLPRSGLLFPLELLDSETAATGLTRTLLGVDEAAKTLTFAGEIIQGGYLRLMNASLMGLIEGAESAAAGAQQEDAAGGEQLALLVSCVGRKLVLGDMSSSEIEVIKSQLGERVTLAGFYSNGEIGPQTDGPRCVLHNQTMTVTTLSER